MESRTSATRASISSEFVSDPRRKSPRKSVSLPGEISHGDKARRMLCRIVDMSATGARLYICSQQRIPQFAGDRIALYFDQHCTCVECTIVWQGQDEVGVKFRSAFHRCSGNA